MVQALVSDSRKPPRRLDILGGSSREVRLYSLVNVNFSYIYLKCLSVIISFSTVVYSPELRLQGPFLALTFSFDRW